MTDALNKRNQKKKSRGNGQGSIYQVDSGAWEAAVSWTENGRRVVRKRRAATSEAADKLLTALKIERDSGVRGAGTMTVAACCDDWLTVAAPKRRTKRGFLSPKTLTDHKSLIDVHVVPRIGDVRLNILKVEQVEQMLQAMADDGKSQSTITHTRYALSLALDRAVKLGRVPRNVARLADLPKVAARPPSKSMTREQAATFIALTTSYRYHAAWVLQLHLGLRPGEVRGLKWSDIDLEAGTLHVQRSMTEADGSPIPGPTKTDKSNRTIPLSARTVEVLKAQKQRQEAERQLAMADDLWHEQGYVFPTSLGLPTPKRHYAKSLQRATKHAGIGDNWSPNELRHTWTSLGVAAGVPITVLADQAGHTSLRMIDEVYRHQLTPAVEGTAEYLDAMFGPG